VKATIKNSLYRRTAMKWLILCFLTALLFASADSTFGQVRPDTAQLSAWERFNSKYSYRWTILWDEQTGTPTAIYGHKTEANYFDVASPEIAARNFFLQNRTLFNIRPGIDDFQLIRNQTTLRVRHIDFQQIFRGVPVFN
jgi:hypothetical protein